MLYTLLSVPFRPFYAILFRSAGVEAAPQHSPLGCRKISCRACSSSLQLCPEPQLLPDSTVLLNDPAKVRSELSFPGIAGPDFALDTVSQGALQWQVRPARGRLKTRASQDRRFGQLWMPAELNLYFLYVVGFGPICAEHPCSKHPWNPHPSDPYSACQLLSF